MQLKKTQAFLSCYSFQIVSYFIIVTFTLNEYCLYLIATHTNDNWFELPSDVPHWIHVMKHYEDKFRFIALVDNGRGTPVVKSNL